MCGLAARDPDWSQLASRSLLPLTVNANGEIRKVTSRPAFPNLVFHDRSLEHPIPAGNRIQNEVLGRERRVSRVLFSPIQMGVANTGRHLTTRYDTMRLCTKCVLVRKTFCLPYATPLADQPNSTTLRRPARPETRRTAERGIPK